MDEKTYPITCALCHRTFEKFITASHLRVAHGMTTAEYRTAGYSNRRDDWLQERGARISGPNHPNWKSSRYLGQNGYIYISRRGRVVLEHRAVMEDHLGRSLLPQEVVHHRDHDRTNNAIENLELTTNGPHVRQHNLLPDGPPMTDLICTQCSRPFQQLTASARFRKDRGQTRFFCSRSCYYASK